MDSITVTPKQLTDAMNRAVLVLLEPVALGLGAFFAMLTISVYFLTAASPYFWPGVLIHAASAAALFYMGIRLRDRSVAPVLANPLGAGIAILVLINMLFPGASPVMEVHLPFFLLMILATGAYLLSLSWSLLVIGICMLAAYFNPGLRQETEIFHSALYGFAFSIVPSLGLQALRRKSVRQSEEAGLRRSMRQELWEKSLQSMESGLRVLAEQVKDIIFRNRIYPEPRQEFINGSTLTILGYAPEEFYADPELGTRILHPDDRARLFEEGNLEQRLGKPFVARSFHKNGALVYLEQFTVAIYDDEGRMTAVEGISRDVTERVQAEQARELIESAYRESLRKYTTLLANLPGMVYRCRHASDFPMELISDGCRELTGYAPEALIENRERSFFSLILKEDRAGVFRETEAALREKRPYRIEYRIRTADGSVKWVHEQGQAVFDAGGQVIAFEGIVGDVNERRDADLRLRLALEAAGIGIWDWDLRADKLTWSGIAPLLGLDITNTRDSLHDFLGLLHPDDRYMFGRLVARTGKGAPNFDIEFRIKAPDGQIRWLATRGEVFFADDRPARMLGHLQDITVSKHAEQELRAAKERAEEVSRVKTSILANVSHEIRTPMTAILGYSDMLARELAGSQLERPAQAIQRGGSRLLNLLTSIIDLARLEGDRAITLSDRDMRVSLDRVRALLHVLADKKGIALTVEPGAPIFVRSDQQAEEQIFTNVISNAIRFTETGSVIIRAAVEKHGAAHMAVVRIFDSGIGISESFLPHIFEEFRQESEGIDRAYEGSGLGLAITKKLIEKLQGDIKVTSTKGSGTTVLIALPLAAGP